MLTCLIASHFVIYPLPTTWVDGKETKGVVLYPCVTDHHLSEKEILKNRIEKMKQDNYG